MADDAVLRRWPVCGQTFPVINSQTDVLVRAGLRGLCVSNSFRCRDACPKDLTQSKQRQTYGGQKDESDGNEGSYFSACHLFASVLVFLRGPSWARMDCVTLELFRFLRRGLAGAMIRTCQARTVKCPEGSTAASAGMTCGGQVSPQRCPECGRGFDPADGMTFLTRPPRGAGWQQAINHRNVRRTCGLCPTRPRSTAPSGAE